MTIQVKGLDEFRRELRKVDKSFGRAVGKANQKVSKKVVDQAKPAVKGLRSPGGQVALPGLKASSKQTAAVIVLDNRRGETLFANVFGTLSHQVWGRNVPNPGPWLPWVGGTWEPEDLHGLGPAISQVMDGFALDEYMDAILDALKPAFPD